ncbi:2,3-bisphosphoglycerate-independent phosphoglycerate mutase [Ensifer psoraleae]|uniref:alkaline phosphatase family protein n=1 Tax=Sinorhizobium psoraleae TaxID=520838 RepID=UPI001569679D|nr:alkaline phosphatase family protein [Sinorhizobium psoraleae]NRP70917.1 2,3-bisphosphoglycerate-independent phosphoglycerate mutase [Sinorhizobium psoraleae]
MKFLVVSFDGLRPDLVSASLTPNICRLQSLGITLSRHRTVYPSETRVAFPSLVTGTTSSGHGMVGNKFVDRSVVPNRYIDTADAVLLDRLNRESNGNLMTAPTLGELLAGSSKTMAVLATNTPGTTRLFHHKAEDFGHVRFSGHFREACTPTAVLAELEAGLGALPPAPEKGEPDTSGQVWITSAFLDYVWPKLKPDVTILSYGEPDTTSHFHGTASAVTRSITEFCDAQFGRVLDWWEAEGRDAGVQIVILSDHGHVTAHTRVSVTYELRSAGYSPGAAPESGVDVVVVPGQVGALYLADRSQANLARLVETLMNRPWCGPIFTAPKNSVEGLAPGSFASTLVFADHHRAPDVYFSFKTDDSIDAFGMRGGTFYDNDRVPGLGVHGGLHPKELAAVGLMAGSAFRGRGLISEVPSGICDIAPTILHLLGLPVPAPMTGRVLREALSEAGPATPELRIECETLQTGLNAYRQELHRVRVDGTTYIDGATVASTSSTHRKEFEAAE